MRLAPLVALALAPSLALALPITLPHHGRLLDDSGPVEGPVTIHFRLFPPKVQGQAETPTWEQQYTVNCAQGVYSVLLGDPEKGTPIESTSVDLAKPLFLAVQVENGPELLPRLPVGHVLFAAQAFDAQKLGGKEPSYYASAADLESARSEVVSALAAYVTANDEAVGLRATKAELTAMGEQVAATHATKEALAATDATVATLATNAALTALSGTVEQNKTTAASATSAVASDLAANYLKTSVSDTRYVDAAGDTLNGALAVNGKVTIGAVATYTPTFTGTGSTVAVGGDIPTDQWSKITIGNGAGDYAGIGVKVQNAGSTLSLGTSNNYAAGITNEALSIDPSGNVRMTGNVTAPRFNGSAAGLTNIPASVATVQGRYIKLYDQEHETAPVNPLITVCGTKNNYVGCAYLQMVSAYHAGYAYMGGPKAVIYQSGNIPYVFKTSGSGIYMETDSADNFFRITSSFAITPTAVSAIPAGALTVGKLNP